MDSFMFQPSSSSSAAGPIRRLSSRKISSGGENRVTKTTKKKKKPGLSINTNVTSRHQARPPQEIQPVQRNPSVIAAAILPTFQPPPQAVNIAPQHVQYQAETSNPLGSANSPSKFPPTYLDKSLRRTSTLRQSVSTKDLYFAPPPRPASSVYSRNSKNRFSVRRKSNRESNVTAFEDDHKPLTRQRTLSSDTVFEEDGINTRNPPDTANTITPHRSRGWWNVITTPFVKTPVEGAHQLPVQHQMDSAHMQSHHGMVPPVPSIPNEHQISRNGSSTSLFSPAEQDVPIAFEGDFLTIPAKQVQPGNSNTVSPLNNRMPFADLGKTPPSGYEEFSPAGLMAGEGVVASSRGVVNTTNLSTVAQSHSTETMVVEDIANPQRTSFHATVGRAVRILLPRHSVVPPPPGEYTPSKSHGARRPASEYEGNSRSVGFDAPPTPHHTKSTFGMVFKGPPTPAANKTTFGTAFKAPPTPHARKTSFGTDYEEFEYEEDIKAQKRKKSKMAWLSVLTGKTSKPKNNDPKPRNVHKKEKKKMSRRRKCCFCCLCVFLVFLALIAVIIVLAVMFTRKPKPQTEQMKWVNITNFPPLVVGSLTVARPNLVASQSGCVNPTTVWSCALPKEQQDALRPNAPNEPNFLFNIRFDNTSSVIKRSASGPAYALHKIRALDSIPNPSPPSTDDQIFLGKTTENNVEPFNGQETPFYISFSDPSGTIKAASKVKRDGQPGLTNSIVNIATNIPKPLLNPDGTPPPANLLPFPTNQPLRLYNRGKSEEHYGFYTYFDRNIFLRDNTIENAVGTGAPADSDGGVAQTGANKRCTWTNTRFLVQIWTQKKGLLPRGSSASKMSGGDFTRPGNFPYPITITMDRHGGGLSTKQLFCFSIDAKGRLNTTQPMFQGEQRDFGGKLQNASPGPTQPIPKVAIADGGPGGIDGGTGGCACKWQNWS